MDNLATIQKVKEVKPCPNSDNLDLVKVLGWQIVTKRNEFKENDLCIYIVIDTVLPERVEFEFLRNKHFRIKPIRLRGQESAGICFPLNILSNFGYDLKGPIYEGLDVTDILKVIHYEKPIPAELAGQAVGGFPGFLIITDELNLRTYPTSLDELYDKPYYITRKDDGCSGTFFINNNEFGVCSRRIHLKESETNGFWRMEKKYNIKNSILKAYPNIDIAIQGEVVGPGIQKNKLGLSKLEFHLFNIFDIKNRRYFNLSELLDFTSLTEIPFVKIINQGESFKYSLDDLIKLSNEQKYLNNSPAEGIVIRPQESFYSIILNKAWSGKVLNENFKEKD